MNDFFETLDVGWTPALGVFAVDLNGNAAPIPAGAVASGTTAQRPAGAATGAQYFDTTLGIPICSFPAAGGTGWVNAAGVPV
ncbi:MAG: hypothetical protein HIU82_13915 [Proteobacteria bacterium]|nr:hypothetical protein [Pseudomonadota bacterium]